VDSVFLAKNGRDKRLPDEDNINKGREKASRYTVRRPAISGIGQSRLQIKTAVKIQTKRFPDQMRRLHKACEAMTGKGKIQVRARHLEPSHVDALMAKTGLDEEEIHNLYVSFTRYDIDDGGFLDRTEVRQVLCDLGLQPRGGEEKVEVHEIICDADQEGLQHFEFNDFVFMVKSVRERLRQIQLCECMLIFEDADEDGNGSLCMDEVFVLLDKRLHMMPRTDDEKREIVSNFHTSDRDGSGSIGFDEFQDFVQRSRAKLMMMRREEELTIAKAFQLQPEIVAEFRMDLPQLWAIFNRYDRRNHSSTVVVTRPDLIGLLIDVGVCPVRPAANVEKMSSVNLTVDFHAREDSDFPCFLRVIHELRIKNKQRGHDELLERFTCYDKHRLGALHYSQVYQILADFKMLPKSREEQQSIVSVIERMDTDGSGSFDFDEFNDFFQRLTEQVQMNGREEERQMIFSMGFTELQLQALRNVFFRLNPSALGKIAQIGLVSAVNRTRDILCPHGKGAKCDKCEWDELNVAKISSAAQKAPDRQITFQEFAQALRMIMAKKEEELDEG